MTAPQAGAPARGSAPFGRYFPGSRRRPIQHGTIGGYRAHYRHGDLPACEPCREAERHRQGYKAPQRRAQCGTEGGYVSHQRRGETPCEPCRAARAQAADRRNRARRGDQWPYEQLTPVVAELTAQGLALDEIADQLNVSKLRVSRTAARARRGAT